MNTGEGLILRIVPYTDNTKIIHCFSSREGLISLFHRGSKKQGSGHIRTGSFIEFKSRSKGTSSIPSIVDARWHTQVPSDQLAGESIALWLFTIELLQKSLKEGLALPDLFHRLMTYYAYLTQGDSTLNALVPLVLVSSALGISDREVISQLDEQEVTKELMRLGIDPFEAEGPAQRLPRNAVFNIELERFQRHCGIERLESLFLIGE